MADKHWKITIGKPLVPQDHGEVVFGPPEALPHIARSPDGRFYHVITTEDEFVLTPDDATDETDTDIYHEDEGNDVVWDEHDTDF